MVEPNTAIAAIVAAARTGGWARQFFEGGELDRLLDLLDRRFGDETGLSATQLELWKKDKDFTEALFSVAYSADWKQYGAALERAVLRLIASGPDDATLDERDLAADVVAAIREKLTYAKRGDEVTRFEAKETRREIAGATAKILRTDWAPMSARDLLEELAERHEAEALRLQEALEGREQKPTVLGLINDPPRWVCEGSGLLQETLAGMAEGAGLWKEASKSWLEASERSDSDRPRTFVRAGLAAYVQGRDDEGKDLLTRAEKLEPDHPLVLIQHARAASSPKETLDILDRMVPRKDRQEAMKQALRAEALAELDRFAEAREALDKARTHGAADLRLRESEAELIVHENRSAWLRGDPVDVSALRRAAESFIAIRDHHRDVGAYAGSVVYLGKAAEAHIRAGETRKAIDLLLACAVREEELDLSGTREHCSEQLIKCGRPDLALEMLPQDRVTTDEARLIRAMACVHAGVGEELDASFELLDREVAEGQHKPMAAVTRLAGAIEVSRPWSDEAEDVLRSEDSGLAALLKSQWLSTQERWGDAERELDPFADEPRVQHELIQIALAQDDAGKVQHRVSSLLAHGCDYAVRLDAARALVKVDDLDGAARELERIRQESGTPESLRLRAIAELAQIASSADRFGEVLNLTDEWIRLRPGDRVALWGRAHALTRRGRFREAAELLDENDLKPGRIEEARLAARIYSVGVGGEDAVRRIAEIADAHGGKDEDLEAVALFTALRSANALPKDLLARVSADRFVRQFPTSAYVRAVPAPETREEVESFLVKWTAERAERIHIAEQLVLEEASAPSATLAMAAGRTVHELWRQHPRRAIGFGDTTLDDLERTDAAAALSLGAVWDPASLCMVSLLSEAFGATVRNVLHRSVMPQASLDELLADASEIEVGGERTLVGTDDRTGKPWVTTWTEEVVEEDRQKFDAITKLADSFDVEPNAPPEDRSLEAKLMREQEIPHQLETYLATLTVARRLGLPVFSDDRFVRIRARQAGLHAFGSLALIDALVQRGDISESNGRRLRRRLRSLGAIGTTPSADELIEEAREAHFALTTELAIGFLDPYFLRADALRGLEVLMEFLRAVYRERRHTFDTWTARAIDVVHRRAPLLDASEHAGNLILFAWRRSSDSSEPNEFLAAFARSCERATLELAGVGSPHVAALRMLADALESSTLPLALQVRIANAFVDDLPLENRHRLREALAERQF